MIKQRTNKLTEIVDPRHINIFRIALFIFLVTFVTRLYVAGQSAAKNVEIKDLYTQKQALQKDVTRLRYEDLRLSSLSAVQDRAMHNGFIPFEQALLSIDIRTSQPLASR